LAVVHVYVTDVSVVAILRQRSADERAWSHTPRWDLLHSWAGERLSWSCYTHGRSDSHVWGDGRRRAAVSHGTGGLLLSLLLVRC